MSRYTTAEAAVTPPPRCTDRRRYDTRAARIRGPWRPETAPVHPEGPPAPVRVSTPRCGTGNHAPGVSTSPGDAP